MTMIAPALASPSLAPPEASPSLLSSATSSRCLGVLSQSAGAGGVHFYRLRLLASSCSSAASSSSSFRKNGSNGLEFGEVHRIRIGDQRGDKRWKASPAKDSSGDVLQTDPAEASRPRLTISGSDEEREEENGVPGRELGGDEEGLPEQERILKTDSFLSSAASEEEEEEEVSPSSPGKRKQDDGGGFGNTAAIGTVAAGLGMIGLLGGFGAVGYLYKDQVNEFLIQFSEFIEGYGPAGYGIFVLVYAGLEVFFWRISF